MPCVAATCEEKRERTYLDVWSVMSTLASCAIVQLSLWHMLAVLHCANAQLSCATLTAVGCAQGVGRMACCTTRAAPHAYCHLRPWLHDLCLCACLAIEEACIYSVIHQPVHTMRYKSHVQHV